MKFVSKILLAAALTMCSWSLYAATTGSQIELAETSYDFGEIKRGEVVTHEFRFKNIGDSDLILTGVHAACGCTVVEFTNGKSYKPGAEGVIRVSFDAKNFKGSVSKSIAIMTNESVKPSRNLTIKAKISADIVVDPPLVNFGEARRGGFSEKLIQVIPNSDVVPVSLEFDPKLVVAELKKAERGWVVNAKLIETQLTAGHLRNRIFLVTNSKYLPKVEIPLRAEVLGSFKTSPSYLEFGNIPNGSSVERKIAVEYYAPESIISMSSEININGVQVERASEIVSLKKSEDGKTIFATLNNNAAMDGSAHGKILLQTSDAGQKQLTIDFYAFLGNVR